MMDWKERAVRDNDRYGITLYKDKDIHGYVLLIVTKYAIYSEGVLIFYRSSEGRYFHVGNAKQLLPETPFAQFCDSIWELIFSDAVSDEQYS